MDNAIFVQAEATLKWTEGLLEQGKNEKQYSKETQLSLERISEGARDIIIEGMKERLHTICARQQGTIFAINKLTEALKKEK